MTAYSLGTPRHEDYQLQVVDEKGVSQWFFRDDKGGAWTCAIRPDGLYTPIIKNNTRFQAIFAVLCDGASTTPAIVKPLQSVAAARAFRGARVGTQTYFYVTIDPLKTPDQASSVIDPKPVLAVQHQYRRERVSIAFFVLSTHSVYYPPFPSYPEPPAAPPNTPRQQPSIKEPPVAPLLL